MQVLSIQRINVRNILLILSYDGTNFCGWQRQPQSEEKKLRTVQEELERALAILHKTEIIAHGSGRTDSGVHGIGQAVTFLSPIDSIPLEKYPLALNSLLPRDIRILSATEKSIDFHARFSATARTYRYYIATNPPFAHEMNYLWYIGRKVDISRLNRMASLFCGEIDCTTFSAAQDQSPSKSRYLYKAVFYPEGEKLVFEISANAFLWKMVRSIVGSLLYYEKLGYDKEEFRKIIESKNRKLAGPTAPPQGLFLWNVSFSGTRINGKKS
ncbi:MAG: tRNA pseudouridine(38-40) synthase TruA [Spirochaetaceae bacterium]|nr:tRNA pseudouridine(38-40) synthase TruA [Spirochaetaceae bacterium]